MRRSNDTENPAHNEVRFSRFVDLSLDFEGVKIRSHPWTQGYLILLGEVTNLRFMYRSPTVLKANKENAHKNACDAPHTNEHFFYWHRLSLSPTRVMRNGYEEAKLDSIHNFPF